MPHHTQIRPVKHEDRCHAEVEEVEGDRKDLALLMIDFISWVGHSAELGPVQWPRNATFKVQVEILKLGIHSPAVFNDAQSRD